MLIPSKLTAGTTLRIPIAVSSCPAPTFVVSLHLRGASAINLTASAEGAGHLIEADAATTSGWAPGTYWWALRADGDGVVVDIEDGRLTIAPNLVAAQAGYDGRSHARRVLDAIEAVIEGRASRDQQSYTIGNRSLQRTPIADLLSLRAKYRAEVAAEDAASRGSRSFGRMIKAVMP